MTTPPTGTSSWAVVIRVLDFASFRGFSCTSMPPTQPARNGWPPGVDCLELAARERLGACCGIHHRTQAAAERHAAALNRRSPRGTP